MSEYTGLPFATFRPVLMRVGITVIVVPLCESKEKLGHVSYVVARLNEIPHEAAIGIRSPRCPPAFLVPWMCEDAVRSVAARLSSIA